MATGLLEQKELKVISFDDRYMACVIGPTEDRQAVRALRPTDDGGVLIFTDGPRRGNDLLRVYLFGQRGLHSSPERT
jgi:hypothetical protein